MNFVFPNEAVSVIVLPSGQDGAEILKLAEEWTASWLLGPALWVECDQIPLQGDGPPFVSGWMLGRNSEGKADKVQLERGLFWALGSQKFKLVRLIAVRSEQDSQSQEETNLKVKLLAKYLDAARPEFKDKSKIDDVGAGYIKLNLLFAPTGDKAKIPQSVVEISWDANIVASAEDRPFPGAFDSFVTRNERYAGYVLAHIACAAGIWSGLPKSTYEIGGITHANTNRARFQRVFVRAVSSDKLSGDIAHWALTTATSGDNEGSLARVETNVAPIIGDLIEQKSNQLVQYMLKGINDAENFEFRPLPENRWLKNARLHPFEVLATYIKDVIDALRYLRPWVVEELSKRIDDQEDSAESSGHLPPRLDPRFAKAELEYLVNKPRPKVEFPSPLLWKHLRETLASAVDSPVTSKHPDVLVGKDGTKLIFGNINDVLPDPDGFWSREDLADEANIRLEDVDWLGVPEELANKERLAEARENLHFSMKDAAQELSETAEEYEKAVLEEEIAIKELERANQELMEDIDFAESMRTDHSHQLPVRMVGQSRPTVKDDADDFGTTKKSDV